MKEKKGSGWLPGSPGITEVYGKIWHPWGRPLGTIDVEGTVVRGSRAHVCGETREKIMDGALRGDALRDNSATGMNALPLMELPHASGAIKNGFVAVELGLNVCWGFIALESLNDMVNGSTGGTL